jgi:tetratricopeptide (TPR) repeat protein
MLLTMTAPPDRMAMLRAGFDCLDRACFGDAEALGRDLLRHRAGDVEALLLTGLAIGARGHAHRAAPMLDLVAQARPDVAHPCRDLAGILQRLGRCEDIVAQYRESLLIAPDDIRLRYAFADYLHEAGQPQDAADILAVALRKRPDFDVGHNLMGIALYDLGRIEEAMAHFRHAIAIDPQAAMGWANLGMALKTESRFEEAFDAYNHAIACSPDDPQIQLNRAIALLRAGRMAEAWPDYECRLRVQGQANPLPHERLLPDLSSLPDLTGRTVLVTHEEGFGDTLQFLRYVPLLAVRGAKVLVWVPKELNRLLASQPGPATVLPPGAPIPPHDFHCPFFSLPRAFGTDLGTIPSATPYLHADAALAAHWEALLPAPGRRRVGLVWAGQARPWLPGFAALDRRRSMKLAEFAPLAAIAGANFISLQKGPSAAEPPPPGLALHDPMPGVTDFADTAAIIANLDLVVSVDTSVAHLAAAMGKPILLLDRYDSCWRWLSGREDSPWYPSLRILRQSRMGVWDDVIARAAKLVATGP